MNWQLPFLRRHTPMPTVKPPREEIKPIISRPKPHIVKIGKAWVCKHPDTVPPGYDWPNHFEGDTPRAAWVGWWVFCSTARCPGRSDRYHLWTYGYRW